MAAHIPVIALTSGEPAGIGPELCAQLAHDTPTARIVVLGDASLIAQRTKAMLPAYGRAAESRPGIEVLHLPLAAACTAGTVDPANAGYVLALLDRAIEAA